MIAKDAGATGLAAEPRAAAGGPVLTLPGALLAFHVMAKPTGAVCNLDCEYCFFLSKEMLYPGSRFRMAEDLQETYIRSCWRPTRGRPEVVVAWQGGEPTMMGLDFFRRSIELERRYARPGQRILNTLQTNGTLLDDEWGAFLQENDFLVGISIDGPPRDARRLPRRQGRQADLRPGAARAGRAQAPRRRLERADHRARGERRPRRAVYRFLRDELGATFVQFIPIVERATERDPADRRRGWGGGVHGRPLYAQEGYLVTHRSVGPAQYGRFMIDVFEEWVRRDIGTVYVQMFDSALANWYGEPGGMCVHAETCGSSSPWSTTATSTPATTTSSRATCSATSATGTCWSWSPRPQQRKFGQDKRDTLTRYCLDCDVRFACNGGCPKDRFATSPYGEPGQHYLCPGYQIFFRHVDRADGHHGRLLRAGRAPAELMAVYAAAGRRARPQRPVPLR